MKLEVMTMMENKIPTATKDAEAIRTAEHTRDTPVYVPATDIYETPQSVVVVADMPGVDEKHVDINLENNVLTLSANREAEADKSGQLLCCGYTPGSYKRTFALTDGVDREGIKARMKDGVLRITLPKSKELQPRKITVEAGQ